MEMTAAGRPAQGERAMTIYDNKGGGRRSSAGLRQILLILLVLALAVGTLFMISGAVPRFNPDVQYNNQEAPGGGNPSGPVP